MRTYDSLHEESDLQHCELCMALLNQEGGIKGTGLCERCIVGAAFDEDDNDLFAIDEELDNDLMADELA